MSVVVSGGRFWPALRKAIEDEAAKAMSDFRKPLAPEAFHYTRGLVDGLERALLAGADLVKQINAETDIEG